MEGGGRRAARRCRRAARASSRVVAFVCPWSCCATRPQRRARARCYRTITHVCRALRPPPPPPRPARHHARLRPPLSLLPARHAARLAAFAASNKRPGRGVVVAHTLSVVAVVAALPPPAGCPTHVVPVLSAARRSSARARRPQPAGEALVMEEVVQGGRPPGTQRALVIKPPRRVGRPPGPSRRPPPTDPAARAAVDAAALPRPSSSSCVNPLRAAADEAGSTTRPPAARCRHTRRNP